MYESTPRITASRIRPTRGGSVRIFGIDRSDTSLPRFSAPSLSSSSSRRSPNPVVVVVHSLGIPGDGVKPRRERSDSPDRAASTKRVSVGAEPLPQQVSPELRGGSSFAPEFRRTRVFHFFFSRLIRDHGTRTPRRTPGVPRPGDDPRIRAHRARHTRHAERRQEER